MIPSILLAAQVALSLALPFHIRSYGRAAGDGLQWAR